MAKAITTPEVRKVLKDPELSEQLNKIGASAYADIKGDEWYLGNLALASYFYINGDDNGNFRGNDPVTRQEAAIMLTRDSNDADDFENEKEREEIRLQDDKDNAHLGIQPFSKTTRTQHMNIDDWAKDCVLFITELAPNAETFYTFHSTGEKDVLKENATRGEIARHLAMILDATKVKSQDMLIKYPAGTSPFADLQTFVDTDKPNGISNATLKALKDKYPQYNKFGDGTTILSPGYVDNGPLIEYDYSKPLENIMASDPYPNADYREMDWSHMYLDMINGKIEHNVLVEDMFIYQAIHFLYDAGIFNGTIVDGVRYSNWDKTVTRAEMITLIQNTWKYRGDSNYPL